MSEDFTQAMTQALEGQAGDTELDSTPIEPTDAPETEPAPEAAAADTAPDGATGDQEWHFNAAEFDQAHPELAPYRKQLQGSFTKAQQELAEQRKAYEGVDPGDVAFLKQVSELATWNPQAAAQMLDQAKQQLLGAAPLPQGQTSQGEEPEFATDVERQLWQRLQAVEQQTEAQQIARTRAEMDRQFQEAGQQIGQEIPYEQRAAAARYCLQNGIPPTQIGMVWKGLYGFEAARKTGRSEAASVVERKAGIGNGPSSLARGQAPPRDVATMSLDDALRVAHGVEIP